MTERKPRRQHTGESPRRWRRTVRAGVIRIAPYGRVYALDDAGDDAPITDRGRRQLWVLIGILGVAVAALWVYVLVGL